MNPVRTLPLFDPNTQPGSWNERMSQGEYAVHRTDASSCAVLPSFEQATVYAQELVAREPSVRARIYDHNGFVGEPFLEVKGTAYRGEREMSPRLRRWLGGGLLATGVALVGVDWASDFKFSWPALVGSRLLIPGVLLVFTEWMIVLTARQKRKRAA